MPITQERLNEILSAGEEFELLWGAIRDRAGQELLAVRQGRKTWEEALLGLTLDIAGQSPGRASKTLAMARQHYNLTRAKNESEARRRARRKLERGGVPAGMEQAIASWGEVQGRTAAEVAAEVDAEEGESDWLQPPVPAVKTGEL